MVSFMRDLYFSGIHDILNLINEHKYQEARGLIQRELQNYRENEVRARRLQLDAIVQSIFQLNLQIHFIQEQYRNLAELCPPDLLSSVDEFITILKLDKVELEAQKKLLARGV